MPRTSTRPKLVLTSEEKKVLDDLSRRSRTAAVRDVPRAQILLRYHAGETVSQTLFGKMARTFLKHIRMKSLEELHQRILKGINEINEMPVVHRWKAFQALEKMGMI